MATTLDLSAPLHMVHARIDAACALAQRPKGSVQLLCVSKTQPPEAVRAAFATGERQFGENYVQEALAKMEALADLRSSLVWHLIGPLQSNKTRLVAEAFDWVHSVDSYKLAQRLNDQRPPELPPLQLCLQVNVDGEASKSGLAPTEVPTLAQAVAALPRLRLRGLMSIPAPAIGQTAQRQAHQRLAQLLEDLNHRGLHLDTLSMGMSDDLEAAVLEGSTLVRVGTSIFGKRA